MPLPLTVTVSVSTVVLLYMRVKVMVPVGLMPFESTAESFSIVPMAATFLPAGAADVPRVTEVGIGVVES